MSTLIPKSIALVDFMHMLTVHFKATANDAGPNQAGQRTLNDLAAIRQASEHVIVCMDSPPYWRKEVFPGYKAGREREPEFGAIVKWTIERLHADGYNVAAAPTEEADDVLATLTAIYTEEYGCTDVRIVGADKDALQLVNEHVRCFVAKGRGEFEIRDADWVRNKFERVDWTKEDGGGPEPKDIALVLAIMGDTSDKIPGIKGIGVKGAVKLVNTYKTPAGMAVAVRAQVEAAKMTGKMPAFWKNYAAGMAELPKWIRLTTLKRDAALEKHPLKYLEKLPMQKLVQDEPSDADDSAFYVEDLGEIGGDPDWDAIAEATAERERAELAAALPVGGTHVAGADDAEFRAASAANQPSIGKDWVCPDPPPAPEQLKPRIGKDPNADKVLAAAAAERDQRQSAPENAARIEAGNKAERELFDRYGQERPKAPSAPGADSSGHQAAASADPKDAAAPATNVSPSGQATAPATAAAKVVPRSQGPQPEKLSMTVVPPPSWELATQPRSPSEMAIVAARFYNSRFYSAHGNADGTFAVIALGRELGLGAAASVEGFHIVNQRPFAKAVMLKALAERDPNCEWIMITSADDKQATIKTKHRKISEVLEYTYTIERAAKAGYLTGKNAENWKTKTQEMLEARATSKAVRRWYPGATFGMHSVEEAGDD